MQLQMYLDKIDNYKNGSCLRLLVFWEDSIRMFCIVLIRGKFHHSSYWWNDDRERDTDEEPSAGHGRYGLSMDERFDPALGHGSICNCSATGNSS